MDPRLAKLLPQGVLSQPQQPRGVLGNVPPQGLLGALAPQEEIIFQTWARQLPWYQEFQKNYGEAPDLNAKEYDYRAAFKAGVQPERYGPDGGKYHWPSKTPDGRELKAINHPTAWMEDYMQITGRDPHQPGPTLNPYQAGLLGEALKRRYGK